MINTVWKYELQPDDYVDLEMPIGAKILCVQSQNDHLCMWCLVNPNEDIETRRFRLAGTGHPIKEKNIRYIDTAQLFGAGFLVHIFEVDVS